VSSILAIFYLQAYEQYKSVQSPEASKALQYMILAKIMTNQTGTSLSISFIYFVC
jgi:hypothetical protein